jgi:hypothetical protein
MEKDGEILHMVFGEKVANTGIGIGVQCFILVYFLRPDTGNHSDSFDLLLGATAQNHHRCQQQNYRTHFFDSGHFSLLSRIFKQINFDLYFYQKMKRFTSQIYLFYGRHFRGKSGSRTIPAVSICLNPRSNNDLGPTSQKTNSA